MLASSFLFYAETNRKIKKVKDFRNPSERRHQLWVVILIIILGIMQSYTPKLAIELSATLLNITKLC
jgi:hypothetical protein